MVFVGKIAVLKTFAFRTDASLDIGTGHVMRCLTLADALRERGAKCLFICREHPGNLLDFIRQQGFQAYALPLASVSSFVVGANDACLPAHAAWLGADWASDAEQTLGVLCDTAIDWLIVDHYALDIRWEQCFRSVCRHLMVIDDLADRVHDCNFLLDQNWFSKQAHNRYDAIVPAHCVKLLGPQYALLKPEYALLRGIIPPRDGVVRRILVFMGGSDPTNQTAKVLYALTAKDIEHLVLDVVIGVNHPNPEGITALVAARPDTCLHRSLPSLAGLMVKADLMIGAGGSTNWERMCLGLPCIVISIADNQTKTNRALMEAGYIDYLGDQDEVATADIANAVRRCLTHSAVLKKQSKQMQALVSGVGIGLLCQKLFERD